MIFCAAENFIFRGVRQAATKERESEPAPANETGSGIAPLPVFDRPQSGED
jgi:hypothetical protein